MDKVTKFDKRRILRVNKNVPPSLNSLNTSDSEKLLKHSFPFEFFFCYFFKQINKFIWLNNYVNITTIHVDDLAGFKMRKSLNWVSLLSAN